MNEKSSLPPGARAAIESLFGARDDVSLVYKLDDAHHSGREGAIALDLGLLFAPTIPEERYDEIRLEITGALDVELNTHLVRAIVLNDASANLSYTAVTRGELLFRRGEEERGEFESRIRAEFLRTVYESSVGARRSSPK